MCIDLRVAEPSLAQVRLAQDDSAWNSPRRCLQIPERRGRGTLGLTRYSYKKSAEAQPNAAPFFIEKRSQEHRQWSSFVAAGDGGLSPYGMNPRPEAFWWRERQQIPFDCGQGRLSVVPTEVYAH